MRTDATFTPAGSGPPAPRPSGWWTRQRVAAAMREWRMETGRWPTVVDWTPVLARRYRRFDALAIWETGRWPHASTVRRAYGSWAAAHAAVTRKPRERPYKVFVEPRVRAWTRGAILEAVHRWAAEYGRLPTYQDWDPAMARRRERPDQAEDFYESGDWPHASVVARRFDGSWQKMIAAARGGGPPVAARNR